MDENEQLNEQEQEALKAAEDAHIEDALGQVVDTTVVDDVDTGDKTAEELEAEQAEIQAQLDKALGKEPEAGTEAETEVKPEAEPETELTTEETPEVIAMRERLAELEAAQAESAIYDMVGGQESYQAMTQWAETGLPQAEVDMYNRVMAEGSVTEKTFAARALQAMYTHEVGHEGVMYSGKGDMSEGGTYRSDEELYADMSNPLYSEDSPAGEAFRSKVAKRMGGMATGQTMDGWVHA